MIELLDARQPAQRTRWSALHAGSPAAEPFAHPAYVELFAEPHDAALCVVAVMDDGGVLLPIIERRLAREPWAQGTSASDWVSPYGYGGAFAWGSALGRAAEFWRGVAALARAREVVTSFARLSLFADEQLPFDGDVAEVGPNVVRELALDEDALWRDYDHKVRKNVQRARRSGLTVEVDEVGRDLAAFTAIYEHTMERRGAPERYRFTREFFERLTVGLDGSAVYFHVRKGGEIVSTELVLASRHRLYSFLGGTLESAFDDRPNDLLKHEVITWGRAAGRTAFVLGGGYQPRDGIHRYKLAFAPSGEVPFHVGRQVYAPQRAEELVALRRAYEQGLGQAWSPREGYFPPYRS